MAPIQTLFSLSLLVGASLGRNLPRSDGTLEKRGPVDDCKAVLVALKASSFCSSFVPITDSTKVVTSTRAPVTSTLTVNAPPCTITGAPAPTVTVTTDSTTTTQTTTVTTVTVTVAGGNKKRNPEPAPATASAKATCSIKGVPAKATGFACDIIKQACNAYVKPKTVTVSNTGRLRAQ
jgi:hypothetical protein